MSVTLTLIGCLVVIVLIKLFPRYREFRKYVEIIDRIPGPKKYPVIGNAFEPLYHGRDGRWAWLCGLCAQYPEGIFRIWLGHVLHVELLSPETVGVIMSSKSVIAKARIYNFIRPWLGTGLLTSSGEKWHRHRKLITPTFHFNILESFEAVMSENAEILKKCIKSEYEKDPKKPIDVFVLLMRCTLDIICESSMGINIHAQTNYDSEYSKALHNITVQAIERMYRPWLHHDGFYRWTSHGRILERNVEIAHRFTNQVIKERKLARTMQKQSPTEDFTEDKPKRQAFLDHLLDACERDNTPLTDDELREEVDTFLFAGHDTTAAAMSWALFSLGNHPDIQDKIHQEQLKVFGDSREPATLHQISELKYLERVIKETLRLYPSAPAVARVATEDLEVAGYKIPKGTTIDLQIHHVQRHPKHWTNPDQFDPDRFLPENSQGRHPYAYVPFSAGPRNCIGQKYAMLEQKIVLNALLRSWRVKSLVKFGDEKLHHDMILRPQNGIQLYFTPKNI
ncbi:cytochrome P450 4C1-like [Athalia rosae]|uniref:cytochrome P450 4C1-like n=1 Tax=Athalia rosae TaxID=37344 RepID=UPI002033C218|nr:cytochrome P450 4C1-like [Athalia rosae]